MGSSNSEPKATKGSSRHTPSAAVSRALSCVLAFTKKNVEPMKGKVDVSIAAPPDTACSDTDSIPVGSVARIELRSAVALSVS